MLSTETFCEGVVLFLLGNLLQPAGVLLCWLYDLVFILLRFARLVVIVAETVSSWRGSCLGEAGYVCAGEEINKKIVLFILVGLSD